jgi:malate dehydrogenase
VTTAAIIGAGDVGGAAAHALATRDAVHRILLVDAAGSIAEGKALDIQQSGAITGFHTRLRGTRDLSRAAGCDVYVVADPAGPGGSPPAGQDDVAGMTWLARIAGRAPIVFAGPGHAPQMLVASRDAGVDRSRLIGSAPEALAAAVRAIVALEAGCAPGEVMTTVLGAPPDGFVVPWSDASIGGTALEQMLSTVQLARVEARVRRLWPPQPYALGLAAAVVAEGAIRSARRAFSVFALLDGEFGARNRVGAIPVLLSATGIVHRRVPALAARERTRLQTVLGS